MNHLYRLAKNIKFNSKKKKNNNLNSYIALGVFAVAIAGTVATLLTKNCCKEIENIVINNAENNDEHSEDDIDEEAKINRNEIKQTLEHVSEDSLGDVGLAMEDALEDLEEEKDK